MSAAAVLLGYVLLASWLGPRVLLRSGWPRRSPRSGLVAWQALSLSLAAALVLAGAALAAPLLPLRTLLADLIRIPPFEVEVHYASPWGPVLGVIGGLTALVLAARVTFVGASTLRTSASTRRRQREGLALVGRPHPGGFTVVEHPGAAAYCVPGRDGAVVVTSGAVAALSTDQLDAVVGHERRHLQARHDLALAFSGALARTFGWLPAFGRAHAEIAVLVEMQADDAARDRSERHALAQAVVTLSAGARPEATLAAGDTAALVRVRRLVAEQTPPRRGSGLLVGVTAAVVLSLPVGVAIGPAVEAAVRDCCAEAWH